MFHATIDQGPKSPLTMPLTLSPSLPLFFSIAPRIPPCFGRILPVAHAPRPLNPGTHSLFSSQPLGNTVSPAAICTPKYNTRPSSFFLGSGLIADVKR